MRISDWSSDVCSSDLPVDVGIGGSSDLDGECTVADYGQPDVQALGHQFLQQCRECARGYLGKIVLHDLPSAHGEPLRPCGNEALGDRLADDASMLFREGLQLSRVAADDRGRDLKAITRCQGELAHLARSEEHTSELQSLMRISYAVFCLKKKKQSKYYNDT